MNLPFRSEDSGPAAQQAALQAKQRLLEMAFADPQSPLHGTNPNDLGFKDGNVFVNSSPATSEPYTRILARHGN
jgi:xanthine dehydrogenase YagR molybdenum-binding subunit